MRRRRIHLHAGTHKTGSSSIQRYLFDHRHAFAARGYRVFEDIRFGPFADTSGADPTNCLRLAHLFLRDDFGSPVKLRARVRRYGPGRRLADIRRLRDELDRIASPDLLISAEALCFLRTPSEKRLMRAAFAGFDVVPIVFFREKTAWLESLERQFGGLRLMLEGQGRLTDGVPDDYPEHVLDFGPASGLTDAGAIRRFFGDGIYLDYEQALAERGSVIPAFLEAIGIDPASMPPQEDYWDNPSSEKRDWPAPSDQ